MLTRLGAAGSRKAVMSCTGKDALWRSAVSNMEPSRTPGKKPCELDVSVVMLAEMVVVQRFLGFSFGGN